MIAGYFIYYAMQQQFVSIYLIDVCKFTKSTSSHYAYIYYDIQRHDTLPLMIIVDSGDISERCPWPLA